MTRQVKCQMIPQYLVQAWSAQEVCWLFFFLWDNFWGTSCCFVCFQCFPTSLLVTPYTLQQQLHHSSGFVSWIPLTVSVCRGLLGGSLRVSPSRTLNWRSPGQPPVRVFRGNQGDVSPSGAKPTTKGDVSILILPSPPSFVPLFHHF